MMKMKRTLLLLALFPITLCAQLKYDWSVGADGLFDNREYKGEFTPQTIYGMRLTPEIGLKLGADDRIAGGLAWITEFGAREYRKPDITLYYSHKGDMLDFHFGAFPRKMLQRQLPESFLSDSVAFFSPNIEGTMLQMEYGKLSTELYINWFSRQTTEFREAFRIVEDGFLNTGLLGCFDFGWYAALTHYAKPKAPGYTIYEKLMLNPYAQFSLDEYYALTDIKVQVGFLASSIRCRQLNRWVHPLGFTANASASLRLLKFYTEIYAGDKQLTYISFPDAGVDFHRGEPFYNSFFYWKNEISALLFHNDYAEASFAWRFHITPDCPIHNQQLIRLNIYLDSNHK